MNFKRLNLCMIIAMAICVVCIGKVCQGDEPKLQILPTTLNTVQHSQATAYIRVMSTDSDISVNGDITISPFQNSKQQDITVGPIDTTSKPGLLIVPISTMIDTPVGTYIISIPINIKPKQANGTTTPTTGTTTPANGKIVSSEATATLTVIVDTPKAVSFLGSINTNVSVMDMKTARQAFGSKTADQFHILDVVLANRILKRTDIQNGALAPAFANGKLAFQLFGSAASKYTQQGQVPKALVNAQKALDDALKALKDAGQTNTKPSILVYSSSISLPVKLECRLVDKRLLAYDEVKDKDVNPKEWHNLTKSQALSIEAPIAQNAEDYGVSPLAWTQGYRFCYRPYATDFIQSTNDARSSHSSLEKIFTVLGTVGVVGGFLTATNAIGGSSKTILGQFSTTFVPALRDIFPDKSQFYRENVLHYGMKEYENIPYGQQIQRLIFVPSQQIDGIIPGYQVRITAIYTNSLNVRASAIDDTDTVSTQTNKQLTGNQ